MREVRGKEGKVAQSKSSVRTTFSWRCGVKICDGQWAAGKAGLTGKGQGLSKDVGITVYRDV